MFVWGNEAIALFGRDGARGCLSPDGGNERI
jgi:hypothetical protein